MGKSLGDMIMGVASAAFQIEGGWNADGKGESIWDRWCHIPGTCKATGDVACDFYHKYEEDLLLLKELGVESYRFSVSWPRVLPKGYGEVNPAGLTFYKNIVKRLKEYNIKAAVTLNHWDLPQKLQDIGGWANRQTAVYFKEYAELMFRELGEDVDAWITHNEPSVVAFTGHQSGRFAPGHRDVSEALLVCHNLLLGHGMAVKAYREGGYHGRIGMSMGYFPTDPATDSREDRLAAQRDWESQFGWFTDPVYKGHYPEMMWEYYTKKGVVLPEIKEGDMETISAPVDFLGVNFYRTAVMRHCDGAGWPYDNEYVPNVSEKINRLYRHRPEKLYDYLKRINDEYMPGEIIISENGFSNQETTDRYGRIMDYDRIDYLYRHIEQCIRARENGIPVSSYYVWCFLDDLEWTGGYATRMGLVRVNYETQERTVKESGRWYQRVIRERCLTD